MRENNRRVQSFPSKLIADGFGFKEEQFFEVDESLRGEGGVPHVDFTGAAPGVTFGDGSSGAGASVPAEPMPPDPVPDEPPPPSPGGQQPPPPPVSTQ